MCHSMELIYQSSLSTDITWSNELFVSVLKCKRSVTSLVKGQLSDWSVSTSGLGRTLPRGYRSNVLSTADIQQVTDQIHAESEGLILDTQYPVNSEGRTRAKHRSSDHKSKSGSLL